MQKEERDRYPDIDKIMVEYNEEDKKASTAEKDGSNKNLKKSKFKEEETTQKEKDVKKRSSFILKVGVKEKDKPMIDKDIPKDKSIRRKKSKRASKRVNDGISDEEQLS